MNNTVIPHSRPSLDRNDSDAVSRVIRSGNIAQGKIVAEFEREMATYIGSRGAIATSSGTASLHLALVALEIGHGDHVAIPSFVCTALLNVIRYVGATPILVDINRETYNMDTRHLKKKITRSTKAIILPHLFGLPADIDDVISLGIPVIEDCAQSVGAVYRGKMVGSYGTLSCFSFYATKVFSTGEGGMVTSNSKKLLKKISDLREYDNRKNYITRYNYKMTDIHAALGLSQLKKLKTFLTKRVSIAEIYSSELQGFCKIPSLSYEDRSHIFYRFIIQISGSVSNALRQISQQGVMCARPIYKPIHKYLHFSGFPASELAQKNSLSLPIYPTLSKREICTVLDVLKKYCTTS
ncbi:MAG: DegT/DnrJ/EryC1/StrS family aminotransferase [Candidatus Scalindua sp. AMX11]|nr:MAG: DegT/DnrJ/EryC1/StrS family aminotransferase [Candidatus Scalindua sp.]NOG84456.1 DegT/DnrJ/EryC1/StrS family aminotransferase [Planctomycetota bacterium]RZV80532.1 MAG: DegT/DnrJ/EryC1/StrS family aminotransferase [Candidatus Scalindua sp. SCAELEC01]TDE65250.1 MAG: DegT/DnrJ/EryC1/StrS family aminotransferase [Candidatus Scalindua sp. AMX11]GJQ58455.1 MAG: aminotransferase DegT [Candidatus Scalindua sp.]